MSLQEAVADDKPPKRRMGGLGPFAIMSLSYILFTTTDGGVRIIVLLHAYKQGFTALALAAIFSGYELAGMIVNLLAGMAGMLSYYSRGVCAQQHMLPNSVLAVCCQDRYCERSMELCFPFCYSDEMKQS